MQTLHEGAAPATPWLTLAQVLSDCFMCCAAFHSSAALLHMQATGRRCSHHDCVSKQAVPCPIGQQAHTVTPAKCCQRLGGWHSSNRGACTCRCGTFQRIPWLGRKLL